MAFDVRPGDLRQLFLLPRSSGALNGHPVRGDRRFGVSHWNAIDEVDASLVKD
jgi:hypothetical protein